MRGCSAELGRQVLWWSTTGVAPGCSRWRRRAAGPVFPVRFAGPAVEPSRELSVGLPCAFEIFVESVYLGLVFVVQEGEFIDLRLDLWVGNDRDPIGRG